MKRVSFKVAKAIKEAGYPQCYNAFDGTNCHYTDENTIQYHSDIGYYTDIICAAPLYLDVQLWLWREKKIFLAQCYKSVGKIEIDILDDIVYLGTLDTHTDPEEAIEQAIKYLVDNDLIK